MKKGIYLLSALYGVLIAAAVNSFLLLKSDIRWLFMAIPVYVLISLFGGTLSVKTDRIRLRVCAHGVVTLISFLYAASLSVLYHIAVAFYLFSHNFWQDWVISAIICILSLALYFWNGILCVYFSSLQMGIKQRVLGIVCGMLPVLNLIVLGKIIKTVLAEVNFESDKEKKNRERAEEKICRTKYPILLVHGVFFRDTKYFNYWGRIPKELIKNGATVFYGNHASAASIENSAKELAARIKEILAKTGAEKVNIIAHSKGGLDCRYAIANLDMAPYVASLTTINTPHRGCLFADDLLQKIPKSVKLKVADTYNSALKKFGEDADFLAAVEDLTASHLTEFDKATPAPEGIFCQSVGSVLSKPTSGKFPLNLSYRLVKYYDGANDGLVSEGSFGWGEKYTLLKPQGERGISHGDMIDLNRENIEDFDVREFYVQLVNDLKNKGL